MSDLPGLRTGTSAPTLRLAILLLGLAAGACTHSLGPAATQARLAFAGVDAGGDPVRLELTRRGPFTVGRGSVAGRELAVACLSPVAGPAAVALRGGWSGAGELRFDAGSARLDLSLLGPEVELDPAPELVEAPGGEYSGRFSSRRGRLSLELSQWAEVIAGHGDVDGRAVVLAATVEAPDSAEGLLLFADGTGVSIALHPEAGGLAVEGLAAPRTLKRRRR